MKCQLVISYIFIDYYFMAALRRFQVKSIQRHIYTKIRILLKM